MDKNLPAISIMRNQDMYCKEDQYIQAPPGYQPVCIYENGNEVLSAKGYETSRVWIWLDVIILVGFYLTYCVAYIMLRSYRDVDEIVFTRKEAVKQNFELQRNVRLFRRMSTESSIQMPETHKTVKFLFDNFVFRNVTFDVPVEEEKKDEQGKITKVKSQRRLLNDLNGVVARGQMVALMGPSGAGKTTLLDALSGKINNGELTLGIDVNGKSLDDELRKAMGYCEQTDKHIESATVREAFRFSADLRVDPSVSTEDKYSYVETIMDDLRMRPIADTYVRNLSAEQKKLVTIGVELSAQTSLVFLDEPTTGLDTTAAGNVISVVRRLADKGLIVICTIHQPSQRVFNNFDGLCLLAKGEMVFFGFTGSESEFVFQYFSKMGYEALPKENPADYVLRVCQGKGEEEMASIIANFRNSPENKQLQASMEKTKASVKTEDDKHLNRRVQYFSSSVAKQIRLLLVRYYHDKRRNFSLFLARIFAVAIIGFFVGTMFYRLSNDQTGAELRMGLGFFICLLASFDPITLVPDVIDARTVFYRERDARTYGSAAFLAGVLLSELPAAIIKTIVFSVLSYYFAGVNDDNAGTFFLFMLTYFIVTLLATVFWVLLSIVLPNSEVVSIVGPISNVVFVVLFSGFVIQKNDIPDYWIWVYYLSYLRYLVQCFSIKVFQDQTFYCSEGEGITFTSVNGTNTVTECGPYYNGEQMMAMFDVSTDDFWPNIGYSLIFFVGFIALSLLALAKVKH